jgi:hypothetical protein
MTTAEKTKTQWLTREQAAGRAGVSVRTIDRWLTHRLLTRHVRGARSTRIDAGELDALLDPTPADAQRASA